MGMLPARYLLAVLGGIGFAIIYGLKVNLSVAIVAMINNTALAMDSQPALITNGSDYREGECPAPETSKGSVTEDGPFMWNGGLQGLVLGSYFWGYMVSQVPGGMLAEKFSAKWVLFIAVFVNVVGTILTPPAAYLHYSALLVMRVLEGTGAGVTFPAMHVMLAKWAPPQERFVLSSIVYAGTALGTVISMMMAGALVAWTGWESVFYVMGGLSLIWCVMWAVLVQDSPQKQRFISAKEREFIQGSLGQTEASELAPHKTPPVPWRKVATSLPFLSILVAHVCSNWGWYLVLTQLPTYMKNILKFPIKENATLSAMPYLCHWFFSMIYSKILDVSRAKNCINISQARKLSTALASVLPAICLIGVGYGGCDRNLAVSLMTISITMIGAMYSGFLSNHIDIAPNYAGTLMGITNMFASIPGFLVPVFVGHLTQDNQTTGQWRIVFFVTAALYVVEAVIYTIFASGVEQPWNKQEEKTLEEETRIMEKTEENANSRV